MFCRFRRARSHHIGLAERFRQRTLLFITFAFIAVLYLFFPFLSTAFRFARPEALPDLPAAPAAQSG